MMVGLNYPPQITLSDHLLHYLKQEVSGLVFNRDGLSKKEVLCLIQYTLASVHNCKEH